MNSLSSSDSLSTVGRLSQMSEGSNVTDLPNISARRRRSDWIYETAPAPPLYGDMFPETSEETPPDGELPSYEDIRYTQPL